MKTIEELTRKISKLMKLAAQGTEEEAKVATEKAFQLASENSLDIATAAIMGEEPVKHEPVKEENIDEGSKLKITDKFVSWILQNHFNVRVLYYTVNRETKISFVGTDSDIRVAAEMRQRLSDIFQHLWICYRTRTGVPLSQKRVYFHGLYLGINDVLSNAKDKHIKERLELLPEFVDKEEAAKRYQLILSEPTEKNKAFIAARYSKIKSRSFAYYGGNPNVMQDGINDGKNVDINGTRKALK